ncbi:MAG: hypothetical protein LBK61_08210 [Spirochaetaceae bacterium]|jgi:hypothetical protein|nr:hypothetical protein [Spirochaetaceae bacterium]
MRRHLFIIAALAVSWIVISCPITEGGGPDLVKPPIVLQLTVTNNMNDPIDVQIRHRYKKGGSIISFSDWKEYDIPAGGGKMLGNETAAFMKDGVETEWSGFVLMDDALNEEFRLGSGYGYSSFELKLTARDKVIQLAGYESESPYFDEVLLCDLVLLIDMGPISRWLEFSHKRTLWFRLEEPTLLTASLLIKADGTYVFDVEPPF